MTVRLKTPSGLDISTRPTSKTITGEYFDFSLYILGKLAWIRVSTYTKKAIPKNTSISVPLTVKPAEDIYGICMQTSGATSISTYLDANITKNKGKSLNISQMFFIQ